MVVKYPFAEDSSSVNRIRTFSALTDDDELIWHRDDEDRHVTVVQAGGWFLQLDDEIPKELRPNETYFIPKHAWHRVLKKKPSQDLIVKIVALNDHR